MAIRPVAILVALALTACGRQDRAQRSKPNYDVVAEGSASGVTSTINGPGETPAPATGTNADTTTNFTLPTNPNPLGNDPAGTTFAGTLPSSPNDSAGSEHLSRPRTDMRSMASSGAAVVTDTIGSTTPLMPKEMRPRAQSESESNTTTAPSNTAMTDTSAPTTATTAPQPNEQPAPKKKKDDGNRPEDQPQSPPPTDTTGTRG